MSTQAKWQEPANIIRGNAATVPDPIMDYRHAYIPLYSREQLVMLVRLLESMLDGAERERDREEHEGDKLRAEIEELHEQLNALRAA